MKHTNSGNVSIDDVLNIMLFDHKSPCVKTFNALSLRLAAVQHFSNTRSINRFNF